MKKTESAQLSKNLIFDSKFEYYKGIGEKAAIYTFKKSTISHKKLLSSLNQVAKPPLIPTKDEPKKSEIDINSLLSPISRDVSHLRDKFIFPSSTKASDLPSDIKTVKKLLETSDQLGNPLNKGLPVTLSCRKEMCMDSVYNKGSLELPSIEKLYLGPPTGRQECSNLKKWFDFMKENYCSDSKDNDDDNIRVLYTMCSRELIRQVSVQCVERGELLQEVIDYFIHSYDKIQEKIDLIARNTSKVKKIIKEDFQKKESNLWDKIFSLELGNKDLLQKMLEKNDRLAKIAEELRSKNEFIEELRERYSNEDMNSLKAFRTIHKTGINTSKSYHRESVFRPSVSINSKPELQKIDIECQTDLEIAIPKKKKKIDKKDEEEKGVDHADDDKSSFCADEEVQTECLLEVITLDYIEIGSNQNVLKIPDFEEIKNMQVNDENEDEEVEEEESGEYGDCIEISENSKEDIAEFIDKIEEIPRIPLINEEALENIEKNSDRAQKEEEKNVENYESTSNKSPETTKKPKIQLKNQKYSTGKRPEGSATPKETSAKQIKKTLRPPATPTAKIQPTQEITGSSNKPQAKVKTSIKLNLPEQKAIVNSENTRRSSQMTEKDNSVTKNVSNDLKPPSRLMPAAPSRSQVSSPGNVNVSQSFTGKASELDSLILQKQEKLEFIENKIKEKSTQLELMIKAEESKVKAIKTLSKTPKLKIESQGNCWHEENNLSQNFLQVEDQPLKNEILELTFSYPRRLSLLIEMENYEEDLLNKTFSKSLTSDLLTPKYNKKHSFKGEINFIKNSIASNSKSPPADSPRELEKSFSGESALESAISERSDDDEKRKNIQDGRRRAMKKATLNKLTEFMEFNFAQRNINREVKRNPAKKLLTKLLTQKIDWIKKKAKMSRKMINKYMSGIYLSYHTKGDFSDPLLDFTYDEFSQRYGIKNVADRKFIEFVASLIVCGELKRCQMFLRFINAGSIINMTDFSQESMEFYLNCLNFMINSKIGIATYDETQDIILMPLARALECVKDKLSSIDRSLINKTVSVIEKKSIVDPRKINGMGVIENEFVLEKLTEIFEDFKYNSMQGVSLIVNALKHNEDKEHVLKYEALIIFKTFCATKVDEIEGLYGEKESIHITDFCKFCMEKLYLNIQDILAACPDDKKVQEKLKDSIGESISNLFDELEVIKNSSKQISLGPYDFWEDKLRNLLLGVDSRDLYESSLALYVYTGEIHRLKTLVV
ncbi:hypothetical protein SteCoe_34619 [Stentor coeruleus]|uniref:EF-hand domain-containing protein n=1 Tax=Stentor coeruleus TaxID=5963 RepID=A0A1R2AU43_9CILI|nr:hypothetical protein SteCoe_34619 [Stentor coeruleus]